MKMLQASAMIPRQPPCSNVSAGCINRRIGQIGLATILVDLLDANVLIALSTPDYTSDYTSHDRARSWFQTDHQFATCPITQGAPLRFHLRLV